MLYQPFLVFCKKQDYIFQKSRKRIETLFPIFVINL